MADGTLIFDTKLDSNGIMSGVKALGGTMGNIAGTGLKVFTAGVGAAAAGVSALGTAAVNSYADYEQLVGGVETLFKDHARIVSNFASSAYMTAGLSANEYMETVTSFSASLLQSLDGDTRAAALKAQTAIKDMSDNANKMGTDMALIQNAYQGFAKQNYTMLDNLKLGYGGTKEEMSRLLADAEAIAGIEYDISSYADVVDAIHVIQEEMGIAGTTAKEASTTISGSLNSVKASWANLLTGIADENANFELLIDMFVDSVATLGENILPRVEETLDGIGSLIETLLPVILDRVPGIISNMLPRLAQSGTNILIALVNGIRQSFPVLMSSGAEILGIIGDGILEVLPMLGEVAYEIITKLLTGITENAPQMMSSGSQMLLDFIAGISEKLPDLIQMAVDAVIAFVLSLTDPDTLTKVVNAGITLLVSLINGILEALPELLKAAPVIIDNLVNAIIQALPLLLEAAVAILGAIAKFMLDHLIELLYMVPILFGEMVLSFLEQDWGQIGKNIIDGIWKGLSAGWGWLVDQVSSLASSLFDAAKRALGINSPSTKFQYLAEMCVAGWDKGAEDLFDTQDMTRNINASLSTQRMNLSGSVAGVGGYGTFNQTVNVNQPISTPDELARVFRLESRYGLMRGVAFG